MKFADIPGQQHAKDGLLKMWHTNTLPHALLLVGQEGVGGLPMALALTSYIFCENKLPNDSCGVCDECRRTNRMEHADMHFSFPTVTKKTGEPSTSKHYLKEFREFVKENPYNNTYNWLQYIKAENKQGNITAQECREIIENLYLKSFQGGKKVLIMWRPEYLGNEGNILLKMIEEPPADTHFILVAEKAEDIIATIRSRTQIVRLAPAPIADIEQKLVSDFSIPQEAARQVAIISQGRYFHATQILQDDNHAVHDAVRELFNCIFTNKGIELVKQTEIWADLGREPIKNRLQYIIQLLHLSIKAHYFPVQSLPASPLEMQFATTMLKKGVPIARIHAMTEAINDTIHYIQRNANAKIQLLALALRLQASIHGRE